MSSESNSSDIEVFSINITEPCSYKTNKNVGIGTTYSDPTAAYQNENDKVVRLFLGAAAE